MKIGLFGGSFNPIHNRHIKLAKSGLESKVVDEIWIVPCKNHAFDKTLERNEYRIDMINLAVKNIKDIKVSRIEMEEKGKNYTINLLKKLRREYSHEFFLLVGSDILYEIEKWHNYKELMEMTEFIISIRIGYPIKKVKGLRIKEVNGYEIKPISSTQIRERVKQGKSINGLVPDCVEKYIIGKGLYK